MYIREKSICVDLGLVGLSWCNVSAHCFLGPFVVRLSASGVAVWDGGVCCGFYGGRFVEGVYQIEFRWSRDGCRLMVLGEEV